MDILAAEKVNGPITDLALKIMKDKNYKDKHFICNYESVGKSKKPFRSSSYFIKDEQNEIIGMICVNVDLSDLISARSVIEDAIMLANFTIMANNEPNHTEQQKSALDLNVLESFEDNIEDLLLSLIKGCCPRAKSRLSECLLKRKSISLESLTKKGYFCLKVE